MLSFRLGQYRRKQTIKGTSNKHSWIQWKRQKPVSPCAKERLAFSKTLWKGAQIDPTEAHFCEVPGDVTHKKRRGTSHTPPLSPSSSLNFTWQVLLHQSYLKIIWAQGSPRKRVEFWYAFFINCSWPRIEDKAVLPGESLSEKLILIECTYQLAIFRIHQPLMSHLHRSAFSSQWLV